MTTENEVPSTPQASPGDTVKTPPVDALALSSPGKRMQRFSMMIFLLIGAGLMAFILLNPFSIPFLPTFGDGEDSGATVTGGPGAGQDAVLYQCPMHPEVIGSEPGSCPICEMKLMPVQGGAGVSTAHQLRLTYRRLLGDVWIALAHLERAIGSKFPA